MQIKVKDVLYKTAITCYLDDDLLGEALASFRKRVELSGLIHYRKNGAPISITVSAIDTLPNDDELPTAKDVLGIFKAAV